MLTHNKDFNENNPLLMVIAWVNAMAGTIFSEPFLSTIAYIGSITGSAVYIYTTLKKNKK